MFPIAICSQRHAVRRRDWQMNKRLIAGLVFFALLLVYCVAVIYIGLNPPGSNAGWHGSGTNGDYRIDKLNPAGPAKDLRLGDRIIAINGVNVAENPGVLDSESRIPPGSRYSMTVQRNGQELTFAWQTIPWEHRRLDWNELIPLLFWLSGLLVLLLKAEDQQAWLLALMLGSFSGLLGFVSAGDMPNNWLMLLIALSRIVGLFSFLLPLHLFLYFPQRSPLLRRWPHLTRWLYASFCLFVLPTFGLYRLPLDWSKPFYSWPPVGWLMTHGL